MSSGPRKQVTDKILDLGLLGGKGARSKTPGVAVLPWLAGAACPSQSVTQPGSAAHKIARESCRMSRLWLQGQCHTQHRQPCGGSAWGLTPRSSGEHQRHAARPRAQVRCTFSVPGAWRHAVGAPLARTLGPTQRHGSDVAATFGNQRRTQARPGTVASPEQIQPPEGSQTRCTARVEHQI
jgi:hypothetical protein